MAEFVPSLSRVASTEYPASTRPQNFAFQAESRLRFLSSRDRLEDATRWYPASKVDAKLESSLHYASGHHNKEDDPGVDIIACRFNAQQAVIGMTEQQFQMLEDHDIPVSRIRFFEEKGQYGHHVRWKDEEAQILYFWWHTPEAFIHELACCVRVDLQHQSTTIVYFDRNEDRIGNVFEQTRSAIDDLVAAPFIFMINLLAEYAGGSESWRFLIDGRIRIMEGETSSRSQQLEYEPDKSHGFNFGRLTMSMQNTNTSLVSLEHVVNWQLLLTDFISEMWTLHLQLRGKSGKYVNRVSEQQRAEVSYGLQNLAKACDLRHHRIIGAQKRMQSQISILLSLISQRDNRINIQLAQESREIAAAAKQDSKIMRVIAVLTLVFLPATLIASIFSTGIFNLSEISSGSSRVSPLWWVYALASLLSTAIVMVSGYLFLRLDAGSTNSSAEPVNNG